VNRTRRALIAFGAVLVLATLVVGVPVVLVRFVGNPWPGRARIELGDDVAAVVGVLAVLAWLVWARFVIAVVAEVRDQVATLRAEARLEPGARVDVVAPAPAHGGLGVLAQRLVAAALVVLPLTFRATSAVAGAPVGLGGDRPSAALVVESAPTPAAPARPQQPLERPVDTGRFGRTVVVAPGDTLIGLARTHLGSPDRWREVFELNRDRPQADGGRLLAPSLIRPGWRLRLPSDAPAAPPAPAAAETITVEPGDNLWNLAHERLAGAGSPHDDASVATYVGQVVVANADVVEDPDLIHPGEQIVFPAIGSQPRAERPKSTTLDGNDTKSDASHQELGKTPAPAGPAPAPAAPATTAAATTTTTTPTTTATTPATATTTAATAATTTTTTTLPVAVPGAEPGAASPRRSPAPIGLGHAAMLTAGVLALLAARRRIRLRAAEPRARVPEPPPDVVATERLLRTVDAGERLLRIDIAVRAAAASLVGTVDGGARIAVVRAGADGDVELTLTASAALPAPWTGDGPCWRLPGAVPIELVAEPARSVGAPCVALAQVGVDGEGRDVLVDLEAAGLLAVAAPAESADAVVRGIAAGLAGSLFAEVANLIGVGIDEAAFLEHRHAHLAAHVDEAFELAATLLGTTGSARQPTFALRARHTGGEAWEPAVVLAGSAVAGEVTVDLARTAARRQGGLAMVVAGEPPGAPCIIRAGDRGWVLEPFGIGIVPVGLSGADVAAIHDVLEHADAALVGEEPLDTSIDEITWSAAGEFDEPEWTLLVRLLGPPEVVDRDGRPVRFERSKTLELIAWLALHREHSTRAGARTALWELDVRDATFANVVSEGRRAMARLVAPPDGEEWLGRTLTEVLPLHAAVIADVDLVRARLDHARLQPPELAIRTLRPAVELIRDLPFAGTGYLWPDAEGITSNLVVLATGAATELAGHCLSMGDVDGVFWATGQGLKVLPGHEELIALRMRAHARAGDLSGVRLEWETYERVLNADPWSDGEPAPKLVLLRRELLAS
jgi:nucleoid-associated protein YgaU/two-component SAPR family response regulator